MEEVYEREADSPKSKPHAQWVSFTTNLAELAGATFYCSNKLF